MFQIYCKLRDERGVNNLQVAKGAGIAPSTLYDWEARAENNSDARMNITHLAKLAKYFDVSLDYFVGEK